MTHPEDPDEPDVVPDPTDIAVGIDGSPTSAAALEWAMREAKLRDTKLRLFTAYNVPLAGYTASAGAYHDILDGIRRAAEIAVSEALERATDAGVDASGVIVEAEPVAALVEASNRYALLVVGSRAQGRFGSRMLGSVSAALTGHTQCPTVIIPHPEAGGRERSPEAGGRNSSPDAEPPPGPAVGVVTGVDGSTHAAAAALVAAEYAQRRGLSLTVMWARTPETTQIPYRLTEAEVAQIQSWTDNEAAWLKGHFPRLDISARFEQQPPVEALSRATATADLVVVGNRGRGGFAGLILGSTSQSLVHHMRGPVMVVPQNGDTVDPRLENRMHAMSHHLK